MGGEGSIAAMIASMKNNNRRKNKSKPFSKYKKEYKKGKPISTKEMTSEEKIKFNQFLKTNREIEKKQRLYKLLISLGGTVIVMASIAYLVKLVFF